MIKFKLRKNLIYLLIFYLSYTIRNIFITEFEYKYNNSLSFTKVYLMTLAETIAGASIFIYQNKSILKKKETKYLGNDFINHKGKIAIHGVLKKTFLIFLAGFFDIFEFIIKYYSVSFERKKYSVSLEHRISSIQTITSSLICTYALGFKLKKHHKASLIIISICLCLTLILDIIYNIKSISIGNLLFTHFKVCYFMTGFSFANCIEKYLADFNFMNPFKILMCEGAFELIIIIIFSIGKKPFNELINIYNNETIMIHEKILLIFVILGYFILSLVVNAYKIYCNVKYSPMARSLAHFFMNPITNIYSFIQCKDFNGYILYFIISEIICLITDFFGCVYNEYIILSCCGLEIETIDAIIDRAISKDNIPLNNPKDFDDNNNDTININDDNNIKSDNINNDKDDELRISVGSYIYSI